MAWAPNYATEDDLASYLGGIDDTVDDVELGLANTAAARAIDDACNRQFGKVASAEERFYTARPDYGRQLWVVDVDDFQDVTGLVVKVDTTTVATFRKEPVNAAAKGRPWTRIAFTDPSAARPTGESYEVSVAAPWGWTAVPGTVKEAQLLQASRFFKRRHALFGIAGSPDMGSELRLLSKVDPDVAVMLRGYVRTRAVG